MIILNETQAVRDVLNERMKQSKVHGFSDAHDDEHDNGALVNAAISYAAPLAFEPKMAPGDALVKVPSPWPWHANWWRPRGMRRNLVKAAALLIAEIERIDRSADRALIIP